MKIIVCFKILPNPDRIVDADLDYFKLSSDLSYAGSELNCFDASSLESAIKVKEQAAVQGAEVTCTALTVSEEVPKSFCENLYAIGFDEVFNIPLKDRECRSKEIATLLAEEIKNQKADFVFFGKEAGFAETGSVPYFVANQLKYPIVADVETLAVQKDFLSAHCRKEDGLYQKAIVSPAVCIFGNSPEVLRYATLKKRMLMRGKTAKSLKAPFLPEQPNFSFSRFKAERVCKMLATDSKSLYSDILKELQKAKNEQAEENPKDIIFLQNGVCIDFKGGDFVSQNDVESLGYPEKTVYCFSDSPNGRKAAADFAEMHNIPCRFSVTVSACNTADVTVQKRICASNILWKETFSLPFVCTISKENLLKMHFGETKILSADEKASCEKKEILLRKTESTNLASAPLLIVCGNGMGSKEAAQKAKSLAQKLSAAFGLTRPAALNAWGNPNEIVGQSGTITAPQCALVLGAAGAGAFMLGIEKAKKIIAVNTDEHALLFQNADIGVKIDAETVVDELLRLLS